MKKYIKIYCDGGNTINLVDEDDSPIVDYIKQLSEVVNSTNYVILETSESSIILKPNTIIGVNVSEEPLKLSLDLDESVLEENIPPKKTTPKARNYIRTKKSNVTKKENEDEK